MSEIVDGKSGPQIKGTRIYVHTFVDSLGINTTNHLLDTWVKKAQEFYPQLTADQVKQAVKYYSDNKEEIDNLIERENQED